MTFSFTALSRPPWPWPALASMPTQSITTSAPSPLLISLIRSKTSSFAKSMMSVAPAFRARAMRSGTVSIAMMRSAPSTLADWIAK